MAPIRSFPHWGVRVDLGEIPIEMSTPQFCATSISLQAYLAPLGHNTQRDRQTDRAIGTDRPCNSISGLKTYVRSTTNCWMTIVLFLDQSINQFGKHSKQASILCCRRSHASSPCTSSHSDSLLSSSSLRSSFHLISPPTNQPTNQPA